MGSQRIEVVLHPEGPKLGPLMLSMHALPDAPGGPAIPQPILVIVTGPVPIVWARAGDQAKRPKIEANAIST
jgi:hypothetical protein